MWGVLYLATRAALPGILFVVLWMFGTPKELKVHPVLLALGLGSMSEATLRIRLYLGETSNVEEGRKELFVGPFDLLKWYQEMCLEQMGVHVGEWRMKSAIDLVPNDVSIKTLLSRVEGRMINIQNTISRNAVREIVNNTLAELEGHSTLNNDEMCERLAFRIRNIVGERELAILFGAT